MVGGGGAYLSGGERQRIAIARARLKDAPIIILDEATANVDPENEDRLQKAIEALTRNKTILMIAHRLKTVRSADQILVLDGGKIVQHGRHEELIRQPGIYADLVGGKKETAGWKLYNREIYKPARNPERGFPLSGFGLCFCTAKLEMCHFLALRGDRK